MRYQTIVSNLSGSARSEWFGREYLVAPVVLAMPGVMSGSKGPLYYSSDELRRDPHSWNGMPLVLNHPSSGSARVPSFMRTNGIGVLARVLFANNRLRGEAWFDVAKSDAVDSRLLPLVRSGKQIEISTGLNTVVENAEGWADGHYYSGIVRQMRPDHLAVLLDQRGACSVSCGCGVHSHN